MSLPYAYAPRRANPDVIFDVAKRAFDIVTAAVLLALLSPLFIVLAILIKRGSSGPVFFRQVRVGRGGEHFWIYKFRTMRDDADRSGPQITSADDSRITTLGKRLRSLKLDELPQLINVVRGEMSLVGPRPQVPRFVDEFDPTYRQIVLAVKPGITGPTQLKFRNEESLLNGRKDRERYYIEEVLPVKCALDVEYVTCRSVKMDLGVLMSTGVLLVCATLKRIAHKGAEAIEDVNVAEEFQLAAAKADEVREQSARTPAAAR